MWFEQLTGFREESPEQVRRLLTMSGEYLTSQINGRRMRCGTLGIPTLADLRTASANVTSCNGELRLQEVVGNVQHLHADISNSGAMFQVASQFNLLEMVGPHVTPEQGVDIYESDLTQGPACAIACGAATIYRNYFVPIGRQRGQTTSNQIDCLADIGVALGNENEDLWEMKNGYVIASEFGLKKIAQQIHAMSELELDVLRGKLRVGIQSNAEVTVASQSNRVSQVFCSALPVAYSQLSSDLWREFAIHILEAAYEATFHSAVLNAAATGNNRVFLTLLGGGAFGNQTSWIIDAMKRSLDLFRTHDLDVRIVSFGCSQDVVSDLIAEFDSRH